MRALRLATISARIASTAPSRPFGAPRARPDCAARAALTASSGSDLPWRRRSCRSARSTSTTRTPGRGEVPGQAGAVAAGALDADQAHGPEPAQPAQQAGVPGRAWRGTPATPSSPPTGSSAAATCTSAWVSTPPVMAACLLRWSLPSLSQVEGWHAPAGRRIREPRPLAQAGQIRPAPPVGARRPGPRPTDRFARQPAGVSRFAGQAGTQARPYARTTANQRKQGRKHYPHPPCRLFLHWRTRHSAARPTHIRQLCAAMAAKN